MTCIPVPVTKAFMWHILWLTKNTSYYLIVTVIISQTRKFRPNGPASLMPRSSDCTSPNSFDHTKVTPPYHFKEITGL